MSDIYIVIVLRFGNFALKDTEYRMTCKVMERNRPAFSYGLHAMSLLT